MKHEIKKVWWTECIFIPMEEANSTTVQILAKAWSIYETRETNGISHFLEHLFFKWWKKYKNPQEVAEAVDTFWWEFNAFTGDEYAGYYVKSSPEFVLKSIDVLWDMMINAYFPEEEMQREKWVVIQEIMMYQDNPAALVMDKWKEFYFWDNSYGRPTLWPKENVESFKREDLIKHKEWLYTKDNLVIIIAGKIDNQKDIEKKLESIFKDLPKNKKIEQPKYEDILPNKNEDFYKKWTEQNHIVISARWFDWNDEKKFAANVFSTILGGNMSSRLFQNIREKQWLCYYIAAKHYTSPDNGVFLIRAGLEKWRFDFGVKKIYEELEKISNWDITPEEFKKAIWYNIGQLQMGIESSDEMANFVWSQYLLYWKIRTIDEVLEIYKNMKIEDVINIAKKFEEENLYKYWIE